MANYYAYGLGQQPYNPQAQGGVFGANAVYGQQANYYGPPPGQYNAYSSYVLPQQQYAQQFAQMQQPYNYGQPPPPMQVPPSMQVNQSHMVQQMNNQAAFQYDCYRKMGVISDSEEEEETTTKKSRRKSRKKRLVVDDDDDEEDEPDEEADKEEIERLRRKAEKLQQALDSSDDLRGQMHQAFVEEMMRRQAVSGTFEMTSGTVVPFDKYDSDDPVCLYYNKERQTDLNQQPWDAEADCEYLRSAMKGLGTNEAKIIHIVATRSNTQRQELKSKFKTMYGRDLIQDLKSELSGDFRETVMACFVKPEIYDAWAIKEAIYGLGTDEESLIEIMLTRTNDQIQEIQKVYPDVATPKRKANPNRLEKDIIDDTSGYFKKLLVSASTGNRDTMTEGRLASAVEEIEVSGKKIGMFQVNQEKLVDMNKVKRDAKRLYDAGEKRLGTDEEEFNLIFSCRDFYSLRAIWGEYVKVAQRDIINSIDRETSGDYKSGLRAIVMNIRNRPMFFAERLVKAMKGLGTDDKTLIRVIISRSEIDLVQIKQCFLELTKQTLWRWLKDDCSGDYKKLLQAIVGKD